MNLSCYIAKSTALSPWHAYGFQYLWLMVVAHKSRGYRQTRLVYGRVYNALSMACISISISMPDDSSSYVMETPLNSAGLWLSFQHHLNGTHVDTTSMRDGSSS
jgi:hypothetical protein